MTIITRASALLFCGFLSLIAAPSRPNEGETTVFPALEAERAMLEIRAAADIDAMRPLIRDFQTSAPDIAIRYIEYVTNDLQREAEAACNAGVALGDILISSSVGQLVKLANDGCASPHRLQNTSKVKPWANWRNEVFGFTYEPAVFVYNTRFVPPDEIPHTRAELSELLRHRLDYYRGHIGTFDIRQSGVGYQFAFEDARQPSAIYGQLIESMSRAEVVIHCCTGNTLDAISSGSLYIGYNLIGSYAYAATKRNPDLRVVVPRDYTLVLSRGVLIPKPTRNPELAARFLNYLLSERGQTVARRESFFFAENMPLPEGVDGPRILEASGIARPIRIGPALLAMQDQAQRQRFIADWSRSMVRGSAIEKTE